MNLSGKLILITGASVDSDIGLAICKKLDQQGAKLLLVGRRIDALNHTKNLLKQPNHVCCPFDLTKLDDISSWVKQLISLHGPIDGLVHSASHQGYSPLRTIKPEQISHYFDLNFSAALLLCAALSKPKHYHKNASLVFIGSAAGSRGLKARTLYAASKAALSSMVQSTAIELAPKSIRVNCVAPALVSGKKADKQLEMLGTEQAQKLIAAHPLGISSPENVAHSVCFLLSELSANTTGITLPVDGGYLAG